MFKGARCYVWFKGVPYDEFSLCSAMRLRWFAIFAVQVRSLADAGTRAIPMVCVIRDAASSDPDPLDEGDR